MEIIKYKCEYCGKDWETKDINQYKKAKNHFCSTSCHMKFMNRELNPSRMTPIVREKLRKAHKLLSDKTGHNTGYEHTYGRHTHRVVAEQMLGRPLKKDEIVHHIDGNKRNNDPSNLKVTTQSIHAKLHFSKAVRCIDTGIVYSSITEAGKITNTSINGIVQCCKGHQKTSGGHHWEYAVKGGDDIHA